MKKHFAIIAPLISLFGLLAVVFLVWPSMKTPGDAFVYISEVIFVLLGILLFAPFRALLLQCKRDKKRKFAFFYFIFVTLYTAFLLGAHGFLVLTITLVIMFRFWLECSRCCCQIS